ncbi:minor capsid protein [bacterium]|nr:minor capsid protein [bacterium]
MSKTYSTFPRGIERELERNLAPVIVLDNSEKKNAISRKGRREVLSLYRKLDNFYSNQAKKSAWKSAYKPLVDYFVKLARKSGYKEIPESLPENIKNKITNYWTDLNAAVFLMGSFLTYKKASSVVKKKFQTAPFPIDIDIEDVFDLPPEGAIEKFKALIPMPKEQFDQLIQASRFHGFTVAGYDEVYALKMWQRAVEKAITEGWTYKQFQDYVEQELFVKAGLTPTNPYHIELVMRNNLQTALHAGKWEALQDDFVRQIFPWLQYNAVMDMATRPSHAAMHGFTAPIDHPEWEIWYPPNGHGCRCTVLEIDKWEAEGLTPSEPRGVMPDPGFEFNQAANWLKT